MRVARIILLAIAGLILGGVVGGSLCGFGFFCVSTACRVTPGDAGAAIGCALSALIAGVTLGAFIGAFLLPIAVAILMSQFGRREANANRSPLE